MSKIEPITVKETENGRYGIISGHSRMTAAITAGLKEIPAIIKGNAEDKAVTITITKEHL